MAAHKPRVLRFLCSSGLGFALNIQNYLASGGLLFVGPKSKQKALGEFKLAHG